MSGPTYVEIDYTNWRGERRIRTIQPHSLYFGRSEYHEEDGLQWLLKATDWSSGEPKLRDFAMKDIRAWMPKEIKSFRLE